MLPTRETTAPSPPAEPEPPPRRRPARVPGKRRRRLRWAAAALAGTALAGVLAWLWLAGASRPPTWSPGEALPEITDRHARGIPAEAPTPEFVDVTEAAGLGGFRTFAGARSSQLPEDMGGAAAWGDYDGDGDEDLFLVAAGGGLELPAEQWAPSQLYENMGDGTFRRVVGFPETRIMGMAAAWGDYDGDGRLDLAVSGYETLLLFRNEGDGRFSRDQSLAAPAGYWAGLAWADFDGDGHLDLYVAGYVRYTPATAGATRLSQQYGAAVPYTLNPASFDAERNLLLRNRGDGTFEEVGLLWGVSNPEGRSLGALWHDFDGDGRVDLYVANDISDNALFLNRGDTFEDAGHNAWVADYRGAMGLAAGDWDRDGDDDLFVTHWLAQENALYDSRLREVPAARERGLLAAQGAGPAPRRLTFTDVSSRLGLGAVALHLVGWGTEFLDFDADGWLDLAVANGSTLEDRDDPTRLVPQLSQLFWNQRGEGFHDLASRIPALARPRVSRGLAVADFDGDGDLDLLLVHLDGGVQLLRNDTPQGNWLKLRLRHRLATGALGQGEGATVVVWLGDVPLRRSVTGVSYLSQSTRTLHFGLGAAERVDGLEVRWPGGAVESFGALTANATWELVEGEGAPRRASPTVAGDPRERVAAFWAAQRAGMDAMKRDGNLPAAIGHFRTALALDPAHEDSRYYLATSLWAVGEHEAALAELAELTRRSPMSHRGHRQWAIYRATLARDETALTLAAEGARRAMEINPEETGALLLLGEIALLQGEPELAAQRFELACRTNPRAVEGYFVRAFLAWRRGDAVAARELLEAARGARGEEWKPAGAAAEGDVVSRMHQEETPLSRFWQQWDGEVGDLEAAFTPLLGHLTAHGVR